MSASRLGEVRSLGGWLGCLLSLLSSEVSTAHKGGELGTHEYHPISLLLTHLIFHSDLVPFSILLHLHSHSYFAKLNCSRGRSKLYCFTGGKRWKEPGSSGRVSPVKLARSVLPNSLASTINTPFMDITHFYLFFIFFYWQLLIHGCRISSRSAVNNLYIIS